MDYKYKIYEFMIVKQRKKQNIANPASRQYDQRSSTMRLDYNEQTSMAPQNKNVGKKQR